MAKVIELKGVHKNYLMGEVTVPALKSVDLEIEKGEFLCITGPSGCGKSTLLNQIGLMDSPTRGKVMIDGIDTSTLNRKQLTEMRLRELGFVFQFFNLIPEFNSIENVMFPMELANVPKDMRIKRARMLLETVGLSGKTDHMPSQLSGGEMQRVSIARALANSPKIIIADEPTGNLDQKSSKTVVKLFKEIIRTGNHTLIMVTHQMDVAKEADRVVRLLDGRIVADKKS